MLRKVLWIALPFVLYGLLQLTGYTLHEADSVLYSSQAVELAARPLSEWFAPEWWGLWNTQGLFREHPPFLHWVFALAIKVLPGAHGATVTHCCFLLLFVWCGWRIGRALVNDDFGWLV